MSTYKEKLDYTEQTKNLIKDAIVAKGVAVAPEDTFRSYAGKIGEIQAGGGGADQGLIKIKTKGTWQPGGNFADFIESIDWTDFNKTGVTDMNNMFYQWSGKTLDISNLSTTGVTRMNNMFYNCQKLTSLDLSNFDTSKVTNMSSMFSSSNSLTSLDLSSFDTSNVTNMGYMFNGCNNLTSLDLSHFDTSKVTNMSNMFYSSNRLTSLDLSNFDTSQVTSMGNMFSYCQSLTSIAWGNNWASNPGLMKFDAHTGYSWDASYSKLPKESVLDLFNKLAVRDNAPVVNVEGKVYDTLSPDEIAIAQNKGWTVTRV